MLLLSSHTYNERCWKIGANRNNVRYCVLEIEKKIHQLSFFFFFSRCWTFAASWSLLIEATTNFVYFLDFTQKEKRTAQFFVCLFVDISILSECKSTTYVRAYKSEQNSWRLKCSNTCPDGVVDWKTLKTFTKVMPKEAKKEKKKRNKSTK